eukprot:4204262-Pyramimonas_sp.AAC.1
MGPRNIVLGGGGACELRHWALRWSSLWSNEACEGCAVSRGSEGEEGGGMRQREEEEGDAGH